MREVLTVSRAGGHISLRKGLTVSRAREGVEGGWGGLTEKVFGQRHRKGEKGSSRVSAVQKQRQERGKGGVGKQGRPDYA